VKCLSGLLKALIAIGSVLYRLGLPNQHPLDGEVVVARQFVCQQQRVVVATLANMGRYGGKRNEYGIRI
jgi:hypothetical protein